MAKAVCEILGCELQEFYDFVGSDGNEIIAPNAIGVMRHRSFHIQEVILFALKKNVAAIFLEVDIHLNGLKIPNLIDMRDLVTRTDYIGTVYMGLANNNIPHMTTIVQELVTLESFMLFYDLALD